jgi:hypothetical protein
VASFRTRRPVCFVEIEKGKWVCFAFSLFGVSNGLLAACSGRPRLANFRSSMSDGSSRAACGAED